MKHFIHLSQIIARRMLAFKRQPIFQHSFEERKSEMMKMIKQKDFEGLSRHLSLSCYAKNKMVGGDFENLGFAWLLSSQTWGTTHPISKIINATLPKPNGRQWMLGAHLPLLGCVMMGDIEYIAAKKSRWMKNDVLQKNMFYLAIKYGQEDVVKLLTKHGNIFKDNAFMQMENKLKTKLVVDFSNEEFYHQAFHELIVIPNNGDDKRFFNKENIEWFIKALKSDEYQKTYSDLIVAFKNDDESLKILIENKPKSVNVPHVYFYGKQALQKIISHMSASELEDAFKDIQNQCLQCHAFSQKSVLDYFDVIEEILKIQRHNTPLVQKMWDEHQHTRQSSHTDYPVWRSVVEQSVITQEITNTAAPKSKKRM